ncbi:MAG: DNA mismatch repair protein MutT [Tenericutes bacterium HGW-Tenericutes-3]|nr:MAG: DNA mismatch repair protein MutT [Tenericutes bacterium HGW-Tenericutes-3]
MIPLGRIIIEEGLVSKGDLKDRKTVRAVILNKENQVLLVYSHLYDDYTFPGGGVMENETDEQALKRELKEEIGAHQITIIKPFGRTKEMRYGLKGTDHVYMQTSHYYFCEIHEFGSQDLQGRELVHGLEPRWISVDLAIENNKKVMKDERHQTKGLKTVLIREIMVLNKLKELNLCANLK